MANLHVLILPSWYPSANDRISGSFFREQAIGLSAAGCSVGVVAVQPGRGPETAGPAFNDNGVITQLVNARVWPGKSNLMGIHAWKNDGYNAYLQYVEAYGRPDVVHAHSIFSAGFLAEKIHANHQIPYVLTEHSSSFRKPLIGMIRKSLSKEVVTNASLRVAVSSAYAQMLEAMFGTEWGFWGVIPNMVGHTFFRDCHHRGRLNSDKECFEFVSIALLSSVKNMELVLRSFATAFAGNMKVKLRVVGDGPEKVRLEQLSRHLGLQGQVIFSGLLGRDKIPQVLAGSDALVVGSNFESFGLVLVEAHASGIPVISTDCGGPKDIINGANGILVPVGDVAAMASAMTSMHEDYGRFDSERIATECREKFSEAAVTKRLIEKYQELR